MSDNLCSGLFSPVFLLLFSHSRGDVELLGNVRACFQLVSFWNVCAGLDCYIIYEQPQSCPPEFHRVKIGDDTSGSFWSCLSPAASLNSLPACCRSVYTAEYIFSECVFVRICLFALSVRDQWHTLISPASGHGCWLSFCGHAAARSPISLTFLIFHSYLFSYLLVIVLALSM